MPPKMKATMAPTASSTRSAQPMMANRRGITSAGSTSCALVDWLISYCSPWTPGLKASPRMRAVRPRTFSIGRAPESARQRIIRPSSSGPVGPSERRRLHEEEPVPRPRSGRLPPLLDRREQAELLAFGVAPLSPGSVPTGSMRVTRVLNSAVTSPARPSRPVSSAMAARRATASRPRSGSRTSSRLPPVTTTAVLCSPMGRSSAGVTTRPASWETAPPLAARRR